MATSRIGRNGRTTVPKRVLDVFQLRPGGTVAYEIVDGRVTLRRLSWPSDHDPFAGFVEWASEADREAFADL